MQQVKDECIDAHACVCVRVLDSPSPSPLPCSALLAQVIHIQCSLCRLRSQRPLGSFLARLVDFLSIVAHLSVSDEFYMTFLPALFWTGNIKLGRQACLFFTLCL